MHSDLLGPERHIFQLETVLVFEREHFLNKEGYGMDRLPMEWIDLHLEGVQCSFS